VLISIRGTNGSGKSTIVRTILLDCGQRPIFGLLGPKRPEAYETHIRDVRRPTYTLGPYLTSTGGVDNVQPYDHILTLIEKYAAKGNVLFEGVIVGSSYGRVGRLLERWGKEAVLAFMATSLEDCIANVKKRRGAREDGREFNPRNLTSKFNQIAKSKIKIEQEGKLRVEELTMATGVARVLELLRSAT
jgi:hypothetical protein